MNTIYWTNTNNGGFALVRSMWYSRTSNRVMAVIAGNNSPHTYLMDYTIGVTGASSSVSINSNVGIFELYTFGAIIINTSLIYYAGTVNRWPKPGVTSPNWGFISTNTYSSVIDYRLTRTIASSVSTPTVTRTNLGHLTTRLFPGFVRVINYQTMDPNASFSYPGNVLENDGTILLTHSASASYTV